MRDRYTDKRHIHSFFKTIFPLLCAFFCVAGSTAFGTLKIHGIFSSNMVIQREKPIVIWGWADAGKKVSVRFGEETGEAVADGKNGRWEVTFPAREASAEPRKLTVVCGDETSEMGNIVIGDVWAMNGQSNMAFTLGKIVRADMELAQADLPLLRRVGISPNEQLKLQTDIPADKIIGDGWTVASPQTAGGFSAIGYVFGSRLQRALNVPIGIIDNARGGAAIESLVPAHKFDDDPVAAAYKAYVEKRIAEFDPEQKIEQKWQGQINRLKRRGVPENKWPKKPGPESLRSWDIPGMSPSDMASCYNGMFGVFKGLGIKGVLFHQGYNNAMGSNCRPKRYRVLMRLMVEGWREDFDDPNLPVGVIGFCAGGIPQTRDNFEVWSHSGGAYIREAQRLGLADVNDPEHTAFLPAYDIQVPGLHPVRKRDHGVRAARWALNKVYGMRINWDRVKLLSAKPEGDRMLLTFDKPVFPYDKSIVLEGFSIADESGKFYMAHAESPLKKDVGIWNTAGKSTDATKIYVWSPLVKKPVAARYAWATSPMGNLYVNGREWLPVPSFRTDAWDWPESDDPAAIGVDRDTGRALNKEAQERCEFRKKEEALLAAKKILKTAEKPDEKPQKGE